MAYETNNLVAILTDRYGNERDRYDDGANDGRVVVTNDEGIFNHIVMQNEEYGYYGFEVYS